MEDDIQPVPSTIQYMAVRHFSLGLESNPQGDNSGDAPSTLPAAFALSRFRSLTQEYSKTLTNVTRPASDARQPAGAGNAEHGEEAKPKQQQPNQPESAMVNHAEPDDHAVTSDDGMVPLHADVEPLESSEIGTGPQAEFIPIPSLALEPTPAADCKPGAGSSDDSNEAAGNAAMQEAGRRPYWMSYCSKVSSPLLRLHQEIVSLVELLHPTPAEVAARQAAVDQVAAAVTSIWPHATVEVFGSFATGLYVPTSDVDLVVLNTASDVQKGLKALANKLSTMGIAKGVQVIAKAKVPIIKFETVDYGGLAFDISFDVPNGPQERGLNQDLIYVLGALMSSLQECKLLRRNSSLHDEVLVLVMDLAAVLVKEVIDQWPMMRPLVLVLKLFLQQRELNEVYTGGIGSYALITMLIAFLQLHNSRRPQLSAVPSSKRVKPPANPLEPSLGALLIDFFRLYGRVINMKQVGISATGGGHYFIKDDKDGQSWVTEGREYMLSVEDPKDPTNDICRSSFNIMRVKSAFDFAYQQLAAPAGPEESLLQRILRLGPILASRPRPVNPSLLYKSVPEIEKDDEQGAEEEEHRKRRRSQSQDEEEAARTKASHGRRRSSAGGGRWALEDGEQEAGGRGKRARDDTPGSMRSDRADSDMSLDGEEHGRGAGGNGNNQRPSKKFKRRGEQEERRGQQHQQQQQGARHQRTPVDAFEDRHNGKRSPHDRGRGSSPRPQQHHHRSRSKGPRGGYEPEQSHGHHSRNDHHQDRHQHDRQHQQQQQYASQPPAFVVGYGGGGGGRGSRGGHRGGGHGGSRHIRFS